MKYIVYVVVFVASYMIIDKLFINNDAYSFDPEGLSKIATEINSKAPFMVDASTQLDEATSGTNTFTYHYSLKNISIEDLGDLSAVEEKVFGEISKKACSSELLRNMLDNDVTIKYAYKDMDDKAVMTLSVGLSDCS